MRRPTPARAFTKKCLIASLALLTIAVYSAPSLSDPPPGKGNPTRNNGSYWSQSSVTADLITAGITISAARALASNMGAIGFKPLPPGIAKNLARGKPLPPGIATRNLPDRLLKGLPTHVGYQWLAAGTDLILINTTSRIVADVLTGVLR